VSSLCTIKGRIEDKYPDHFFCSQCDELYQTWVVIGAEPRNSVNCRKYLCTAPHDNFIRPSQLKPVSHYLINVMDDDDDDDDEISIESDYGGSDDDNNNNLDNHTTTMTTTTITTTITKNNNNNNNKPTGKVLRRNIVTLQHALTKNNHKFR
jgi:hypothetical protein